jgi:hypothetical protein
MLTTSLRMSAHRAALGCRVPWNALLCGRRFAVPEVTPVAVTAERVTGGNLGQGDPEAVGP